MAAPGCERWTEGKGRCSALNREASEQFAFRHLHDANLKLLWRTFCKTMKNPVALLRTLALIEGASFLILLGIAMPLKYLAGLPWAVKWVGWIHGILFILFCASLLQTMLLAKWPLLRGLAVFFAALMPFGPFLLDRRMRVYEIEAGERLFGTTEADLT